MSPDDPRILFSNQRIDVVCYRCHIPHTVHCTTEQFLSWARGGVIIQKAMPDTPAAERELLISGLCGECFRALFQDAGL